MKKTNAIYIIGLIALIGAMMMVTPVVAQEEQWNATLGGTSGDQGKSVQQTSDGGYIIAGNTWSYGTGTEDVWLVKTDSNGIEQWNKTFDGLGTHTDRGESVLQASDGGYVIAGYTYGPGTSYDVLLIKTDSNGNEQWNKTFHGPVYLGDDKGYSVNQTSDGGYIITGSSWNAPFNAVWLIKTDSNGNEQWNTRFTGPAGYDGESRSVRQTSDGGYIIAGRTRDSIFLVGFFDNVWLIKTDSNGNEEWNKVFVVTETVVKADGGESVQQTSDGGYIIAGYTEFYGAGGSDVWLIKTDSNGNEQWNKTFGGTGNDIGYSVQQASDGGYLIAGTTGSYGAGSSDVWLIKTASNGIEQWNETFGGTGSESGYSLQLTSGGGCIIAGSTGSYGAGGSDAWLVKIAGGPIWTRKPGWDVPDVGMGSHPALVDIDADDDYDLFIGEQFGVSFAYENTGSASSPNWTAKPSWNLPDLDMGSKPAFADLDNDGDYDMLIGEGPSGATYAYENTGSASSPNWTEKPGWNPPTEGLMGAKPALADLDADGDYDLLIYKANTGNPYAYENTGSIISPSWTRKSSWDPQNAGQGATPDLADLDGDGDYDLLVGNAGGATSAYENTGGASSPVWTAKSSWNPPNVAELAAKPALADLDNDGDYDLLIGTMDGVSLGFENTGETPMPTPTPQPDLNVTEKYETLEDSTFTVTYTVANIGDAEAGASNTTIYVDGTPVGEDPVPTLTAGESYTNTVGSFNCPCGTTVTVKVCADNDNVVSESDKTNNCMENELVCTPCPTTGYTVKIDDYTLNLYTGNVVTVPVKILNATDVAGGSVNVSFDPSIVEVQTVTPGHFGTPSFNKDNTNGFVRIATAGETAVGIDEAVLANILFKGTSEGHTDLNIRDALLNFEDGATTTPATIPGSITVKIYMQGDLNHNNVVDTGDATLVLRMVVGLTPEDMLGDMNGNGMMDTGDATIILRIIVGLPVA